MAKIRILRTAPYSVDGKILSLQIGQEVNLPDSYAQALVGLKQAEYINPPAPPIVEENESEVKTTKSKAKKT